jgi:diguanylate cyclase (GGDEF)-like protein/PAS domain S-box-containing protein
MCVLDAEGLIVQLNPAWENKFNVVRGDIEQSPFLAWVHPDDQASSRDQLALLFNGQSSVSFSNRWRVCAGDYHLLNWEISAVPKSSQNVFEKGEQKAFEKQGQKTFEKQDNFEKEGKKAFETEGKKAFEKQNASFETSPQPRFEKAGLIFYAVATDISTQKNTEQVLRDTEERFELAIQGSNHGLWDWNLKTNEIYLSPRWKSMLGYQDHEIDNRIDEWCRFVHPDDFTQMWGDIEAYLDKRIPRYESMYRVCHKDGNYRWVVARAAALWNENDQPYRMVGTYIDITERKQIEQALQEREALLSAIFDVTKIGLCVTDEEGRFVRVNPTYCELYGYTAKELLGQHFIKVLSPEHHERAIKLHQGLLAGDPRVEHEGEWHIRDRAGHYLEIGFSMGVLTGPNGRRFRVTTIIDVTKRKRLELERNRLFNLSLDMQSIIGFDMAFKEINAAWERTLGWTKAELMETSALSFVHPEDRQASLETIQTLTEGKTVSGFENRYLCKNGTYKWLSWNVYPLVEQQTMYVVTRDITERKQAEKEIQRSRAFIRLVVDSLPNLIFIKDYFGRFIFVNQAVAEFLGFSIDELINQNKPTHPIELEQIKELHSKAEDEVIEHRREVAIEESYGNANGEQCCFHIIKKPFVQSDGEVLVLSVGTNITERKRHEEALRRSEARFKEAAAELETILDNSVIGIAYIKNGVFIRVNNKLESLLCYGSDELCGLPFRTIFASEQKYQQMEQRASQRLSLGKEYDAQNEVCTKGGNLFWARIVGKAVDANELDKGSIWLIEDIMVQKDAEQNLRLTATVFETSANGIFVTNSENRIVRINPAFSKITGYSATDVYGKPSSCLASGRHNKEYYQEMWESINNSGHWQGEIWNRKKTGEVYVAWLSISTITNEKGKPVQYMAILTDISSLQEDIQHVRYLANYDSLTRLPNRSLFHDNLLKAKARATPQQKLFSLLFIDLDGFKPVNDRLGHAIGDKLLQRVAKRLQKCVRETDTVARLGGDEFTVILNNLRKVQDAAKVAGDIVECLQKPFQLAEHCIEISASIGISIYPHDSKDAETLIKYADIAMYEAKHAGKGRYCFYHRL